ncbi:MAG TPA: hypothetical protein VF638_05460 [Sphingomonas sp.]|jgi:hypothetical protein
MLHDPPILRQAIFGATPDESGFFELGPYEVDDVERVTIRRGKPAQAQASAGADDRLDAVVLGKLAIAGAAVGNAIAFLVDPQGSAAALEGALAGLFAWWPW